MFFRLVTSVGQRKNLKSQWEIKPQTFGFRAPMLYHCDTETPLWVWSITKFTWHASCTLQGSVIKQIQFLFWSLEITALLSEQRLLFFIKGLVRFRWALFLGNIIWTRKSVCSLGVFSWIWQMRILGDFSVGQKSLEWRYGGAPSPPRPPQPPPSPVFVRPNSMDIRKFEKITKLTGGKWLIRLFFSTRSHFGNVKLHSKYSCFKKKSGY